MLAGDNLDEIKAKAEALAQSAMKLGEAMYKDQAAAQQGAAGAQGPGPGAGAQDAKPAEDGVVDADFEEVNDSKK